MKETPDARGDEDVVERKVTKKKVTTDDAGRATASTTETVETVETVEDYSRPARRLSPLPVVLILATLAVAVAAILIVRSRGAAEAEAEPVVEVEVATTSRAEVREYVEATGTLNAMPGHEASFSAATAGRVTRVLAQVGQNVRAGQVLAELDRSVLAATVRQQEAAVEQARAQSRQARAASGSQSPIATDQIRQAEIAIAQARANQTQAQNSLNRLQTLFTRGIAARREVEEAQTALAVANASVAQAESALAAARVNATRGVNEARTQAAVTAGGVSAAAAGLQVAQAELARASIRSPIAGTVTKRSVNDGESVDPATPAFEVIDASSLDLVANLPAHYLGRVKTGNLAVVKIEPFPDREFEGGVVQVAPAVDAQTNTVAVRVRLPNPRGELRAGLFADARIAVEIHANALVVPEASLVVEGDETFVFVPKPDETVEKRRVTVGIRDAGRDEISEGLREDERVVTAGAFGLEDGAKIKVAGPTEKGGEEKADEKKGGEAKRPLRDCRGRARPCPSSAGGTRAGTSPAPTEIFDGGGSTTDLEESTGEQNEAKGASESPAGGARR
ncbi:MAG TPA: efflux RND transporter periplasmic adaptor subunit [Pyrinomonadaceae bacterium]|nr:efflux RND transporter periplasmic adaptor subunit [Pyrinomonadaceae bacterium]